MAEQWVGIVLAAGRGTRMRSRYPKVLHPIAGVPMLSHILDTLSQLTLSHLVVVTNQEVAASELLADRRAEAVLQDPPLGTGDALLQSQRAVASSTRHLLVVNGDMPLVTPATLDRVMQQHLRTGATLTIASCVRDQAGGFGRVVRSPSQKVLAIVEEAELSEEQKAASKETNEGIYCLEASWTWKQLSRLSKHPNGEYYLTDLVALAASQGETVESVLIPDPHETMGVNDRVQLAQAEAVLRQRIREALMLSGVTLVDPSATYIDAGVMIGQDTVVYPHTTISGKSRIGQECHIGPNAIIQDAQIGDACHVVASMIEEAVLEAEVTVGPYSHLRPGTHIEKQVHLGNYVEIKNSRIGTRTLVGHFSYIGDAVLGADVNVGAGTITCNFDGVDKHPTHIGNKVFLGSDTMLVAPVTLGDGAATGAGAVVTKDVPPGVLVVGVPARPMSIRKKLAAASNDSHKAASSNQNTVSRRTKAT